MIPAEFEYFAPGSVKEAVALLAQTPGAKLLSGGMSLVPALKHRLVEPAALIDIGRIPGLDQISERRGAVSLGARVTHATAAGSALLAPVSLLCETAASIGDVQVRNRGTLGGSLVHADPAADWTATFLALDAEARLIGPGGERTLPARDFFTGMLRSAVGEHEVVTEIRFPFERKRAGSAYRKLRQTASGFAIVGVAAQLVLDRRGRCERAAVGVTGITPVPFRAESLERRLVGHEPDDARLETVCAEIEEADPMGDLHASPEFRRHLLSVYARRALQAARERASP